jgi:polar amino acid transport system permease protein
MHIDTARQPSSIELGRRAFRRRQSIRSVLLSIGSTLVFAAVVVITLSLLPGWPRVRDTFFDLGTAQQAFPRVAQGFLLNLRVLLYSVVTVSICGMALALLRTLRSPVLFPVRALATGYTDLFRGTPLIVVLYIVGFGIPGLQGSRGVIIPAEVLGTIAITLTYSAYVSEVLRAGIESVHPSQRLAARSLGLSHGQSMRIVVIPQAIRKVSPALMNDFVSMQKDVGLISILGAVDAVRGAGIVVAKTYNYTPYVLAGLLFVLLAIPTIRLTDWYTARQRQREQMGSIV